MAKIMIVDDEPEIVFLVRKLLEKENYEVSAASTGEECLERLKNDAPDLVLMDIMMPGMGGWEACRKIKEDPKTKHIPVAMLTVRSGGEDVERSFHFANCDAHISKPIDKEKLLSTIAWLLKNAPRQKK